MAVHKFNLKIDLWKITGKILSKRRKVEDVERLRILEIYNAHLEIYGISGFNFLYKCKSKNLISKRSLNIKELRSKTGSTVGRALICNTTDPGLIPDIPGGLISPIRNDS